MCFSLFKSAIRSVSEHCQQRGLNCPDHPHLVPPPMHPLPSGQELHLSSVWALAPCLSYCVGGAWSPAPSPAWTWMNSESCSPLAFLGIADGPCYEALPGAMGQCSTGEDTACAAVILSSWAIPSVWSSPTLAVPWHTSLLPPNLSKESSVAIIKLERGNWNKTLNQI